MCNEPPQEKQLGQDAIKAYELARDYERDENNIISQRLTGFNQLQGILVAGYSILITKNGLEGSGTYFGIAISLFGILSCMATYAGVEVAKQTYKQARATLSELIEKEPLLLNMLTSRDKVKETSETINFYTKINITFMAGFVWSAVFFGTIWQLLSR